MNNLKETLDKFVAILDIEKEPTKRDTINRAKAQILEQLKPSTKEEIIYFLEETLTDIPEGFSETDEDLHVVVHTNKRSLMEYNKLQRHPIPYCLIRFEDEYFFISRENGSGELRLIGQKGLIGGHVGREDIVLKQGNNIDLKLTLRNGMYREIEEEAGITKEKIKSIKYKGMIKLFGGVDQDHLGIVYEIELNTKDIKVLEDGVLKGAWINKYLLPLQYNRFEKWAKIVYNNVIQL